MLRTDLFMLTLLIVTVALPVWAATRTTPDVPVVTPDPVIHIETIHGKATISGPAAEYVLESAFPVVIE